MSEPAQDHRELIARMFAKAMARPFPATTWIANERAVRDLEDAELRAARNPLPMFGLRVPR